MRRSTRCAARSSMLCVAALVGCGGAHGRPVQRSAEPQLTPKLARALEAGLRRQVSEAAIPGVSAAIVFPDGREWSFAVGSAELKPRVAMMTRTAFPFDSVTKMATAALALRLAEEGRLRLDDPVGRWYRAGAVTSPRPSATCWATRPGRATTPRERTSAPGA
jgi:D-alanyl-D-alanine carboxypeptidase